MKDRIEQLATDAVLQIVAGGDVSEIKNSIITAVNEALELAARECDHWQSLSATHKCGEQIYTIPAL